MGLSKNEDADQSYRTVFQINAPIAAPTSGATQNIHNCASAGPSAKRATPVERAGLTDVFVTGIDTKWIRVSPKPIAMSANPAGTRSDVAPRMMIKNAAVITTSIINPATMEYPPGDAAPYPFDANPSTPAKSALPDTIRYK